MILGHFLDYIAFILAGVTLYWIHRIRQMADNPSISYFTAAFAYAFLLRGLVILNAIPANYIVNLMSFFWILIALAFYVWCLSLESFKKEYDSKPPRQTERTA
jgi:hypothetical protein